MLLVAFGYVYLVFCFGWDGLLLAAAHMLLVAFTAKG